MFKEEIKKMIDAKEAKLAKVRERARKTEDIAELRALNEDVDEIISELEELLDSFFVLVTSRYRK